MEKEQKPIYTYRLNALLEMQNNLDVMEAKIYYLGLSNINPHISKKDKYYDTDFKMIHIPTDKLVEEFGHTQYLTVIKKTCSRMLKKTVEINFENGEWDGYTVFSHIKYRHNDGLYIKFNDEMKPFLLEIFKYSKKYGYTRIEMKQIMNLSSKYAIRMLEMLLQYRGKAIEKKLTTIEKDFDLEYIRKYLNVPDGKYTRMDNFRKFVLDEPRQHINANTRYIIDEIKPIKKGRKITGFSFSCDFSNVPADLEYKKTVEGETIEEKEISKEEKLEKEAGQEILVDYPSNELYKKMASYNFSIKTIEKLLTVCGNDEKELKARLEYGEMRAKKKKTKPEDISGFLLTAIEKNWLGEQKAKEATQARELEASQTNAEWDLWARQAFADEPSPTVEEKPLDPSIPLHNAIIIMIKKEVKERKISATTRERLKERGLTMARFIELYMKD